MNIQLKDGEIVDKMFLWLRSTVDELGASRGKLTGS
jgi:hypothetical protein